MAAFPAHAFERARHHVARSVCLIERQFALIEALEDAGSDTSVARALLYTMYRSRMLLTEHLAYLERDNRASRAARPSLDDCLQLLALAMHTEDGPRDGH